MSSHMHSIRAQRFAVCGLNVFFQQYPCYAIFKYTADSEHLNNAT